ncbi:MAG: YicC family protein [Gammaproteobacteria bacterium]|nr:YicC family protein [Gammaproteobacteria bacterium]MCP5138045.1 YicC family protein [Gammaproteobacteria bacterium]
MIRSMTAFGHADRVGDWGELGWEVRSVNSRYLEVFPRMPEEFRVIEPGVRERLGAVAKRGKVELMLRFKSAVGSSGAVTVNTDYVKSLIDAYQDIEKLMYDPARVSPLDLMRQPGVMAETKQDLDVLRQAALDALDDALAAWVASRESEGARLAATITDRLDAMGPLIEAARVRMPEVVAANRVRLNERLAEVLEQVEPARIEQEMVLLAQKLDVDEEMDRLESHRAELRAVLKRKEPVGRRMDFLMQEFNREANTLGSKSADTEITRVAVELKVLIEQMREQIQNIE